jgi:hypothetical protein
MSPAALLNLLIDSWFLSESQRAVTCPAPASCRLSTNRQNEAHRLLLMFRLRKLDRREEKPESALERIRSLIQIWAEETGRLPALDVTYFRPREPFAI